MTKQGETLYYVGRLKRQPIDGGEVETIQDLSTIDIQLSMQHYGRETLRLPIDKEEGVFSGHLDGCHTKRLEGTYRIEAAITENGSVLISQNTGELTIESSALGQLLAVSDTQSIPSQSPNNITVSNTASEYIYTLELEFSGSRLAINSASGNSESLVLAFGMVIKGDKGDTGAKGDQGIQGPKGDTGTTAYQSAQTGGYPGTETDFNTQLANAYMVTVEDTSATPTIAVIGGRHYKLGVITALTLSSVADSEQETRITFSVGSAVPTFTFPADLPREGWFRPSLNSKCEISICNRRLIMVSNEQAN